jgi:single-stranded-DNA-specific exonuclease
VIKEHHIKFSLKQNNSIFTGIGFNMADRFSLLQTKKPVDVVFTVEQNEWNGDKFLQLKVCDFKPAEIGF